MAQELTADAPITLPGTLHPDLLRACSPVAYRVGGTTATTGPTSKSPRAAPDGR